MPNNPNLDLVNINASAKFGDSINSFSRYWAEKKSKSQHDRMTDNLKTVYTPHTLYAGRV